MKKYIFFMKKDFSVFFPFISMFWMKMKEKARNILTFHGNSFFSLKIAWIIPFPAFLGDLTSYLRKTIFILFRKKKYMQFHEKSFFSPKKLFFDDFRLITFFSSKNTEYCHNILFFLKKIINDVYFSLFRSINVILNKTPFYKFNICNLNKEENSA